MGTVGRAEAHLDRVVSERTRDPHDRSPVLHRDRVARHARGRVDARQIDADLDLLAEGQALDRIELDPTRAHAVRRISPAQALERARATFPDLDVRVQGRELVATGLVEEHDVVARLARGESAEEPEPKPVDFGPLSRRRFTIQVVSRPVEAVVETLIANGIDVQYDAEQLKAAGVSAERSQRLGITLEE